MSDVESPGSAQPSSTGPKYPAPKDKQCPYCYQLFTSSSLGRHLDLYIKPKNAKPPDGKHDVEEIKRIRGHITRRQPKSGPKRAPGSSRYNDVSADMSTPALRVPAMNSIVSQTQENGTLEFPRARAVPMAPHTYIPADTTAHMQQGETPHESTSPTRPAMGQKLPEIFRPTWLTTGVISGLPPRPVSAFEHSLARGHGSAGGTTLPAGMERDVKERLNEHLETGAAAQRALKEMWNVLEGLNQPKPPAHPFPFDPVSHNFPGLCLRILEPPPTLFSATPFAMSSSCSISPPGPNQYDALVRTVRERLANHSAWMEKWCMQKSSDLPNARNTATESMTPQDNHQGPHVTGPEAAIILEHVDVSYAHFSSLSSYDKSQAWQIELLRAYFQTSSELQTTRKELDTARAEIDALRDGWLGFEREDKDGGGAIQRSESSKQWNQTRLERVMKNVSGAGGLSPHAAAFATPQKASMRSISDEVHTRLGINLGPGDNHVSAFEKLLQRFRDIIRQEEQSKPREPERRVLAPTPPVAAHRVAPGYGEPGISPPKRQSAWMNSDTNGTHYDPIEREFRAHRFKRTRTGADGQGGAQDSEDEEDSEVEEPEEEEH